MIEPIHTRLRKFLQEFFDDEELTVFCFDYFPPVYKDFAQGLRKGQKVRMVVDYNQQRGRFDDLLAALERERPTIYSEHFSGDIYKVSQKLQSQETIKRNPNQIFISHAHQDIKFA